MWDARLLAISAHTARRIVPVCFQADPFAELVGGVASPEVASPLFMSTPQRALYPTANARPSTNAITSFLKSNGIGYIYEDGPHPNEMVPDATVVAEVGEFRILAIP